MGEERSIMTKEFAALRRLIGECPGATRTARGQLALDAAAAVQGSFNPRLAGITSSPASLPWRFSLPYRACA